MTMKLGTAIIWSNLRCEGSKEIQIIDSGTITKIGGTGTYYTNGNHRAEDQIYAAYCYPDTPECRAHLQTLIDHEAAEYRWNIDYRTATFKLRNKLTLAKEL